MDALTVFRLAGHLVCQWAASWVVDWGCQWVVVLQEPRVIVWAWLLVKTKWLEFENRQ